MMVEFNATYDFAKLLLTRYNNTGRTFYIGHSQGDWLLVPSRDPVGDPATASINGMVAWLSTRQAAIDDAKSNILSSNVYIYHYTEANRVLDALHGLRRLASAVLPRVAIDYVSYAAYDIQEQNASDVTAVLNYLQSQLLPKQGIHGKRLFIGEFGIPFEKAGNNPILQEQKKSTNYGKIHSVGAVVCVVLGDVQ